MMSRFELAETATTPCRRCCTSNECEPLKWHASDRSSACAGLVVRNINGVAQSELPLQLTLLARGVE